MTVTTALATHLIDSGNTVIFTFLFSIPIAFTYGTKLKCRRTQSEFLLYKLRYDVYTYEANYIKNTYLKKAVLFHIGKTCP